LNEKDLLYSILGLSVGSIFIDFDHLLPSAYFHWFPVISFFIMFGIGMLVFRREKT